MSFMRIFNIFETISAPKKAMSSGSSSSGTSSSESDQSIIKTWPQIERRTNSDRRQQERRLVNYQPYIDTRKNNGRRRSFGRRLSDQVSALPF
jgi:hypothetical protein